MVKSRKTTVKARPLPDVFSIQASDSGISALRTTLGGSSHSVEAAPCSLGGAGTISHRSCAHGSASARKRAIFPHLTRLQHGILRYRKVSESPTSVTSMNITESYRRFIFVPAGFSIENDQSMREILVALHLPDLPPLVIVTAATDGAVEENMEYEERPLFPEPPSHLDHLSEDEERELLKEKTQELLKSTVVFCGEIGAWLLPHRPRRANGAAEILCSVSTEGERHAKHRAVILGMIGLDQQDHKDGFTDTVTSHMVPVGSQVEKIADVPYDPNVRDNTPCPELTHLVLFQSRRDMRAFREHLIAEIPDVFLAFGKTTSHAKKCLFSTLVAKSPVALVTHTSVGIDNMSWLLRYADRELQKINVGEVDPPPLGIATFAVSGAATTSFDTLPLKPLPDLEAVDPELSFFLPIWPAEHDDERVVLADPKRVSGVKFQQLLLSAVNSAFYIREARTVAIKEATNLHERIRISTDEVKVATERYHLSMVFATFAAVVSAVMYAKIYAEVPPPSFENRNPYQIALFLVTLGIPLLIIYLKKYYDQKSLLWSCLQKEVANLESTIAAFRTRPRTYGQSISSGQEPLDVFVSDVSGIQSRAFLDPEVQNILESERTTADRRADDHDLEAATPSESSHLLVSPRPTLTDPCLNLERISIRGSTSKWKKKSNVVTGDEKTPMPIHSLGMDDDRTQYIDVQSHPERIMNTGDIFNPARVDEPENVWEKIWTLEDYIVRRIQTAREQKTAQIEVLEKRNKLMDFGIKVVLFSTTFLAMLSKQWAIPIVVGASAVLVNSNDFRKYQKRIERGQSMVSQLEDLLKWWDGLELEAKILSENEDRLVQIAESIIAVDASFTF